jgi:hypothetical protein
MAELVSDTAETVVVDVVVAAAGLVLLPHGRKHHESDGSDAGEGNAFHDASY